MSPPRTLTTEARARNYEPNSHEGPRQSDAPSGHPLPLQGAAGTWAPVRHAEDDDFVQAGALYRLMPEDAKQRLVDNLACSLAQVKRDDVIARALAHFRAADPEYGQRVAVAVADLRDLA